MIAWKKLFKQIYENGRWVDLGQDDDQANKIQKYIRRGACSTNCI